MRFFILLLNSIGLAILVFGLIAGFEFNQTLELMTRLGYELGPTLGGAFAVSGALTLAVACWQMSPRQGVWLFHVSAAAITCFGLAMAIWPEAVLSAFPEGLLRIIIILVSLSCGGVLFFTKIFTTRE